MRLLADQDRTAWDRALIAEAAAMLTEALRRRPPTRFAVEAAIAAVHAEAPTFLTERLASLRRARPGS